MVDEIARLINMYLIPACTLQGIEPSAFIIRRLTTIEGVVDETIERLQHIAATATIGGHDPSLLCLTPMPDKQYCIGSGHHWSDLLAEMQEAVQTGGRVEGTTLLWIREQQRRKGTARHRQVVLPVVAAYNAYDIVDQ